MGLGGGRKRVKIGHDPNNTGWSRSTTNYGHRMLLSQGWRPGSALGAGDAGYAAAHLTDASLSHVRAVYRDDNLGLGAKRGSGQEAGECVGLDAFQGLLGRLNGKSDDALEKEQRSRDDLKRARYVERRGLVHFTYAGRLVGDHVEEPGTSETRELKNSLRQPERSEPKTRDLETVGQETQSRSTKKSKKRKGADEEDQRAAGGTLDAPQVNKEDSSSASSSEDEKTRKAKRKAEKAEKKERKAKRRLRREEKAARKLLKDSKVRVDVKEQPSNGTAIKEVLVVEPVIENAESSASNNKQSTGGRHMSVRSRYIAAKRRAVMDPQALKEILMVKA